jgi:hypothetical protein
VRRLGYAWTVRDVFGKRWRIRASLPGEALAVSKAERHSTMQQVRDLHYDALHRRDDDIAQVLLELHDTICGGDLAFRFFSRARHRALGERNAPLHAIEQDLLFAARAGALRIEKIGDLVARQWQVPSLPEPAPEPLPPVRDIHYLDVSIRDENGVALAGKHYRLQLPDGRTQVGIIDASGRIYYSDVPEGTASLWILPDKGDPVVAEDVAPLERQDEEEPEPEPAEEEEEEVTFIEIEVRDDDVRMLAVHLRVELPDGTVRDIHTAKSSVRIDGITQKGTAKVTLVALDESAA